MDYLNVDHAALRSRDIYRSDEEIDLRRRAELLNLVDQWKAGTIDFWRVMHDLVYIMDRWAFSSFSYVIEGHSDSYGHEKHRASLKKEIRPIFFEADKQAEVVVGISAFADHLLNEDMSAYAMARLIVETICQVPEREENDFWWGQRNSITGLISKLDEDEKEAQSRINKKKLVGTLDPEPESVIRARLKPFLKAARRKIPKAERRQRPIASMQIEQSGTGTIKSRQVNPDYLPQAQREAIVSEWDNDGFNPYAETDRKESLYGSTVARISTFTIAFRPKDPTQLENLHKEIRNIVALLAHVRPAFGIPTDHKSGAYKRPYAQTTYGSHSAGPWPGHQKIADQHVFIEDGFVKLEARLDLDDVFNLYYLLENRMTPSAETAQALNGARYAEARSAPMRKSGLDSGYDTSSVDSKQQIGDLSYIAPNKLFEHSLKSALSLYAIGEVKEDEFLREIVSLADHTLAGRLADAHGAFPAHRLLTVLEGSSPPVTYDEALRARATELLTLLAGTDSETPGVVGTALMMRAAQEREAVIRGMQAEEYEYERSRHDILGLK